MVLAEKTKPNIQKSVNQKNEHINRLFVKDYWEI